MKNTIALICFLVCPFAYLFSQINISLDDNCLKYNSATISKAMIDVFGKDSFKQLLDKNTNITFVCHVDSSGYVLRVVRTRSRLNLPTDFTSLIEDYLVKNHTRFFICYQNDPPDITKDVVMNGARKEYRKNNRMVIGSISFPGELMSMYEYDKAENISKYDYLLIKMNLYLKEIN